MRLLIAIGICIAMGLALAACGESGSGNTTTSSVETTAEASGTAKPAAKTTSQPAHPQEPKGKMKMSKTEIAKLPPLTIARQSGPPPRHLEIIDLRKGNGATLAKDDAVTIRYFDAPYQAVQKKSKTGLYGPTSFALVQAVVKGWIVGLPGMKVGGRRELILPPRLVYPRWQPNWGYAPFVDVYVFDLLSVKPSEAKPTG